MIFFNTINPLTNLTHYSFYVGSFKIFIFKMQMIQKLYLQKKFKANTVTCANIDIVAREKTSFFKHDYEYKYSRVFAQVVFKMTFVSPNISLVYTMFVI